MTAVVGQAAYLLLAPAVGIWLSRRYRWAEKLGPVIFAYGFGLLLSLWPGQSQAVSLQIRDLAIPLAIPLLLFSLDVKAWLTGARDTVLAFILCLIALIISATSARYLFASRLDSAPDIAGILAGLYSGGTPNAAVVHRALEASPALFVQINAVDFVSGAIYFFFLISLAGPIYGRFLIHKPGLTATNCAPTAQAPSTVKAKLLVICMALLIVSTTVALVIGVFGELRISWIMLGITSLAIAASFWPTLRAIQTSYGMGYYLVSVFCCAIGSQVQLASFDASIVPIAVMHLSILLGTISLHLLFARLARLDRDTTIITQTAALYGPPFVPPVAGALRNPAALLSGLTTGLVGYAVGNYLGIGLATLLR